MSFHKVRTNRGIICTQTRDRSLKSYSIRQIHKTLEPFNDQIHQQPITSLVNAVECTSIGHPPHHHKAWWGTTKQVRNQQFHFNIIRRQQRTYQISSSKYENGGLSLVGCNKTGSPTIKHTYNHSHATRPQPVYVLGRPRYVETINKQEKSKKN